MGRVSRGDASFRRRPYGTARTMVPVSPTLKRGANLRCASGAVVYQREKNKFSNASSLWQKSKFRESRPSAAKAAWTRKVLWHH